MDDVASRGLLVAEHCGLLPLLHRAGQAFEFSPYLSVGARTGRFLHIYIYM